jgi:hypothetical protein
LIPYRTTHHRAITIDFIVHRQQPSNIMSEEEVTPQEPAATTTTEEEVPKVDTPKEEESTAHFEPVVSTSAVSARTWNLYQLP